MISFYAFNYWLPRIRQFFQFGGIEFYGLKNHHIYLDAIVNIIIPRTILINFSDIYFCILAPKYMPKSPPAPSNMPSIQSGEATVPFMGMRL